MMKMLMFRYYNLVVYSIHITNETKQRASFIHHTIFERMIDWCWTSSGWHCSCTHTKKMFTINTSRTQVNGITQQVRKLTGSEAFLLTTTHQLEFKVSFLYSRVLWETLKKSILVWLSNFKYMKTLIVYFLIKQRKVTMHARSCLSIYHI